MNEALKAAKESAFSKAFLQYTTGSIGTEEFFNFAWSAAIDALSAQQEQKPVFPDLTPVITWLENGCDPKEAAKELRIYRDLAAPQASQPTVIKGRITSWQEGGEEMVSQPVTLTDADIDRIQEDAYRKLVASGYNGGMGGFTWDRASARAIEAHIRALLAASQPTDADVALELAARWKKRAEEAEAKAEAIRREALEQAIKLCESWPLDPTNMLRAEGYAKHGWANAVAGVLRSDVVAAIRALAQAKGETK